MLKVLSAAVLFGVLSVVLIYQFVEPINDVVVFYSMNLRGNLFAGFLTLGGFLFSLKTFIVIKIKESVYDHEKYKERLDIGKKFNPNMSHYGPLQRLSNMLFYSVLFSIITAALQLTIGLIPHWFVVLVCIFSSVTTMFLLVWSLVMIKKNMDDWFDFIEK